MARTPTRRSDGLEGGSLTKALDLLRSVQAGDARIVEREVERAVDILVGFTVESYSYNSDVYIEKRGLETTPWEERLAQILLSTVRRQIAERRAPSPDGSRWRLLDIGAGSGRDLLRMAEEADIEPTALDVSPEMIHSLRDLAVAQGLPAESIVEGDMRELSAFPAATFHSVRNHASLHHLPLLAPGQGADLAIAESRRVLVTGGVLYVLVRAGEELAMIDTEEGLGPRVFQLFSPKSLTELIERHDLRILRLEELVSKRGQQDLHWILCIAVAD